jgi:hypothetical protein
MTNRVLARFVKRADLNPPLGYPGGPCHVVDRIHDNIRSPKLQEDLSHEIEMGHKMLNPDAAKVYHLESEKGVGMFKRLLLVPHAQFRMDLRQVTVPAVRVALQSLNKRIQDLRAQRQTDAIDRILNEMQHGTFEWVDPKMGLAIVLAADGRDGVRLITTYWKGDHDPTAPGSCDLK